jgi:hypothetical protein
MMHFIISIIQKKKKHVDGNKVIMLIEIVIDYTTNFIYLTFTIELLWEILGNFINKIIR